MHDVVLAHATDLAGWRAGARALLAAGVPPGSARWRLAGEPGDLFAAAPPAAPAGGGVAAVSVPRAFLDLADSVIRHQAPERFALLYRLLWRQARGERELLVLRTDPDMSRAIALATQVRRDAYHMRAYLRFREEQDGDGPLFLSWFEPEHHVVELVAPHFVARMGALRWSILTPLRTAHWDGRQLRYAEGRAERPDLRPDGMVECWKTYYASIFNPARLKVDTMLAQMPKKYWSAMDETELIPGMVREARSRADDMVAAGPTVPSVKTQARLNQISRNFAEHKRFDEPI